MIQKTEIMKKIILIMTIALVAAFALPTKAQSFGAEQPNATFQSTSTMTGSGSTYSSNPSLNEDGTASYQGASYSPAGPRKAKKDGAGTPGTPSTPGQGQQENQFPLGDAMWPLLAMLAVYCAARVYRRRRV